ncbi:hypothetical protein CISG_04324 [Coccidioides immitis RMSCC 3703]|uniref:Uncharacterized protein n=1 Tax=Coccidioides immitis RMSCC 3703 TaxID=454286 RepID=A0A0J8TMU4_COCIT|nr:hypothetical protein CISG_04324 [Coccidioides immitis RMSCC 3703]
MARRAGLWQFPPNAIKVNTLRKLNRHSQALRCQDFTSAPLQFRCAKKEDGEDGTILKSRRANKKAAEAREITLTYSSPPSPSYARRPIESSAPILRDPLPRLPASHAPRISEKKSIAPSKFSWNVNPSRSTAPSSRSQKSWSSLNPSPPLLCCSIPRP